MRKEYFIIFVLTALFTGAICFFMADLVKPNQIADTQYVLKNYKSKELGIDFNYPSNVSLSFKPLIPDNAESYTIEAIQVDKVITFRREESYEKYIKGRLEGYVPEENTTDYNLDKVKLNGKDVKFTKYSYGDGQPIGNCLWSDMWISYLADLGNGLFVEIEVEEQTSCDSEKEYRYKTDSRRIDQAIEILKTIRPL